MYLVRTTLGVILSLSAMIWQPDMETARKVSKNTGHPILLNFSGSDWCGPCIRMRKEIFEDAEFMQFADSSLVLINADFPRNRKNQLGKEQQHKNDDLAEKYNPSGKFPYTVLVNSDGNLLYAWDGYPPGGLPAFIKELKSVINANR